MVRYYRADAQDAFERELAQIMPEEACLFEERRPGEIERAARVGTVTSRACPVLDFDELFDELGEPRALDQLLDRLHEAGIRRLAVRLSLSPGPGWASPWAVRSSEHPLRQSATVRQFHHARDVGRERFELSVVLAWTSDRSDLLAGTLAGLAELGAVSVFLDPRGLAPEAQAPLVKSALELLRIRGLSRMSVDFLPGTDRYSEWQARTGNLLRGPVLVDIDVANTCTHNCVFCGFYSPDAQKDFKEKGEGKLPEPFRQRLSSRIDPGTCLSFIARLPDSVREVQFGGLGDPFTHPKMMDFIRGARRRGFGVNVLSNFSYLKRGDLEELHALSRPHGAIGFTINLSAASAKTYSEVRPNQGPETFDRVLRSVGIARELATRDPGNGLRLTLLSVVNRTNFRDSPDLVRLCKETGADGVWLKPMGIFSDFQSRYLPTESEKPEYFEVLRESLRLADQLGVKVFGREAIA